jgi:S-adenosylmethionine decarboxylase
MTVPPPPTITADSPSGDQSQGPFEGPEKLLELWFAPSLDALPSTQASSSTLPTRASGNSSQRKGLRKVPRAVWEEMLDIVKCKVLSFVEGEELDAYLLR